jgi:hypothetical protein
MSVEMEKRARVILRDALLKHYIDELSCGHEVEAWLKTHGGWFPDNQMTYGDGTPLTQPKDEGEDVMSKEPENVLIDARVVMENLWVTLDDEDSDFANGVCDWITDIGILWATASQLTEANVEANDFRLEFAKETLQSFKRGRSRSPRRIDVDRHLEARLNEYLHKISEQAIEIVELQEKIREKDRYIDSLNGILQTKTEMIALKQSVVDDILAMIRNH